MNHSRTTRLAPSPTGPLHLGNARTFLLTWALAQARGWTIILRHEDLDAARATPEHCRAIEETLRWLGLHWNGVPTHQTSSMETYRSAMQTLDNAGSVYPCTLSRKEIAAVANAPHRGDAAAAFPIELRPPRDQWQFGDPSSNYRLAVPSGSMDVHDVIAGDHSFLNDDFVVWTKAAVPAYQLAVVASDLDQGITDVVRGDDLLPSAARQQHLWAAMGEDSPAWWHVPLVFGEDRGRLAKRNGGADIATYRSKGVPAERVIGLLAWWSGLLEDRRPVSAESIIDRTTEAALRSLVDREVTRNAPRLLSQEDHRWLLASDS